MPARGLNNPGNPNRIYIPDRTVRIKTTTTRLTEAPLRIGGLGYSFCQFLEIQLRNFLQRFILLGVGSFCIIIPSKLPPSVLIIRMETLKVRAFSGSWRYASVPRFACPSESLHSPGIARRARRKFHPPRVGSFIHARRKFHPPFRHFGEYLRGWERLTRWQSRWQSSLVKNASEKQRATLKPALERRSTRC